MASKDSTGGATPATGKAAQAVAEVGGVRSSDDPAPDLWFGEPAGERRDATCSAEVKSRDGRGDGPKGYKRPKTVQELQLTLYREAKTTPAQSGGAFVLRQRNSESRMREIRLSGLMRGGEQTVIGLRASQSVASRLLYTPSVSMSLDKTGGA